MGKILLYVMTTAMFLFYLGSTLVIVGNLVTLKLNSVDKKYKTLPLLVNFKLMNLDEVDLKCSLGLMKMLVTYTNNMFV